MIAYMFCFVIAVCVPYENKHQVPSLEDVVHNLPRSWNEC